MYTVILKEPIVSVFLIQTYKISGGGVYKPIRILNTPNTRGDEDE